MIWDLHCHLSGVEGVTVDQRIAKLIEFGDRLKIDRYVFFMGTKWSWDPSPDVFRGENDEVLQALSHWHDRAFGFVYLNPKHVDESLAELDRCVRDGPMVGVKLWIAQKCDDKSLDAIVKRAAELKAVIYQHTWYNAVGNRPGESTPEHLARLAARHPDIPIICGHTGGEWESGIRAIRHAKNVYIGTGGFDPTAGIMEMAVREIGAERIIYGSDIGYRSFATQIAKVHGADIPVEAKRLILGENLRRLMLPILQAKGVDA